MEQGERLAAPGRLRARAGMDRVEVELPIARRGGEVRLAALVLLGLLAPWAALWVAEVLLAPGIWDIGWRGFLEVSLAAGLSLCPLLGMAGYAIAIRRLAARSWGQIVRAGNALLLAGAGLLALWAAGDFAVSHLGRMLRLDLLGLLVIAWLFGVLVAGLLATAWATRAPPRAIVAGARLEIRDRRRSWSFSLEEAGPGEIARARALRALTAEERGWLLALIEGAAQRRRESLERQGHDLAAPGEAPAELLDLARR